MKKFEKRQLVMLPTNYFKYVVLSLFDNKLHIGDVASTAIPQHLYILSDEPIKEGDWVMGGLNDIIQQWQSNFTANWKKIIFTTDSSLRKNEYSKFRSCCKSKEDCQCFLPQPSQEFIKYFIEQYNLGNIITEVQVEYEDFLDIYDDSFLDEGYTGSISKTIQILKIKPENTVNIKFPVEDNFEQLLRKALIFYKSDMKGYPGLQKSSQESEDKWIQENYYPLIKK